MTGNNVCAVDGCNSRLKGGVSFFRCPKEQERCRTWKNVLGFTGSHKYADMTPDQSYGRIRICALHFDENSFANSSRSRIHSYAVPSLRLPNNLDSEVSVYDANHAVKKESNIETNDAIVQTDIFQYQEWCQALHKGTQTTKKLLEGSPSMMALKKTIKTLEKTIKTTSGLKSEVTMEDIVKFLERNFTEEICKLLKVQLSLLNKKPKGSRYTDEFKQFALSVYFLWPKAYKKFSTLFRLPSKSTLERFTRRWPINPGFNEFIFGVIECRASLLKEKQRDCLLCLEEISLKSHLFYDISKDKIIGFQTTSSTNVPKIAGSALIIMARGIASSWKQPIGYFFCETTSTTENIKDILFESVRKLHNIGLNVLGVVSDQGSNFHKLVKSTLKLTEDDPTFFVDDRKLVYLFDIPNLTKSTRNNFFSYIFVLMNEGETRKKFIEMMYNSDKTRQYKLVPHLTKDHIYPNNFQKLKVKFATQIFSHSVAVAMHTYIDFDVLPKEASTTANFIFKMNNLIELLNSNDLEHSKAFMATETQLTLLKEMNDLFQNLKVLNVDRKDVTNWVKFIFGWRMTIKSILILWETLKAKGYKYILTGNLQQDSIKNHFGQIKKSCGNAKHPTPIQFCRSFKKLFALQYFDRSDSADCMDDISEILINLTPEFTKTYQNASVTTPTHTPLKVFTNDYINLNSPEGNALILLTQYLLKKCLLQHSCEVCVNFSTNTNENLDNEETSFKLMAYLDTENYFSGSKIPFRDIIDYVLQLESIFLNKFNDFAGGQAVGKHLKNEFIKIVFVHPCVNFPSDYFITLYTRVRIYFTLKLINIDNKSNKSNIKSTVKISRFKTL